MGRGASEELSRDLQELHDNARYIEACVNSLHTRLRDLAAASTRARSSLDGSERGSDEFQDHARELLAMQYEIGRLEERVLLMQIDCTNL